LESLLAELTGVLATGFVDLEVAEDEAIGSAKTAPP